MKICELIRPVAERESIGRWSASLHRPRLFASCRNCNQPLQTAAQNVRAESSERRLRSDLGCRARTIRLAKLRSSANRPRPTLDLRWLGRKVGRSPPEWSPPRFEKCPADSTAANARRTPAAFRLCAARRVDTRRATQQRHQRRITLQHDAGPALANQSGIANELNGVAQALFVVQQNGLTRERRSIPTRLLKRRMSRAGGGTPTPFVSGPAARKIAVQQPQNRPAQPGRRMLGLDAQGRLIAGFGLIQFSTQPMNHA